MVSPRGGCDGDLTLVVAPPGGDEMHGGVHTAAMEPPSTSNREEH